MRKIQIDISMFMDVLTLITKLRDYQLNDDINGLCASLEAQINGKMEAIKRREEYTKYKTGETPEEREKARQDYLNMAGIHKDWRY